MSPRNQPIPPWQLQPGALLIQGRLALSFQRFPSPPDGILRQSPRSLGALEVHVALTGELLLPVAEGEAVWLGLSVQPEGRAVLLFAAANTRPMGALNVCSGLPWQRDCNTGMVVDATFALDGLRRDATSVWAFQRHAANATSPACEQLQFTTAYPEESKEAGRTLPLPIAVHFVDYATYARSTGAAPPVPLDPAHGYRGELLP